MANSNKEYVKEFLGQIPKFSQNGPIAVHYSLERMVRFCKLMDNPQSRLTVVHVAGTNGKGSTCRLLSSIFQSAGQKVGLYTSPHLIAYNERFKINSDSVAFKDIATFLRTYKRDIHSHQLSYFELSTAMAFWLFSRKNVDLAVIETGLGGRLDATNIVTPILSIITSVGLDHQDFLGKGIENIAREKAGIIKKNTPVLIGNLPDKAEKVVIEAAQKKHSAVVPIPQFRFDIYNQELEIEISKTGKTFRLPSLSPIQAYNFALSYQASHIISEIVNWEVSDDIIQEALTLLNVRFKQTGCYEKLHPALPWYFDGAHNAEAVSQLVETTARAFEKKDVVVVLSLMKDKVSGELLNQFLGFKKIYYYPMDHDRSAPFVTIKKLLPEVERFPVDKKGELTVKFTDNLKSQLVIFTGSFYFYYQVREWVANIISEEK